MAPDEPTDAPESADAPESVFGNLPRSRPGARSPRRDAEGAKARAPREPAAAKARDEPPPPPPPRSEPAGEESGGGLEDVAWGGIAAAAEAATIGVRLATRALEAMRDAVDRR